MTDASSNFDHVFYIVDATVSASCTYLLPSSFIHVFVLMLIDYHIFHCKYLSVLSTALQNSYIHRVRG